MLSNPQLSTAANMRRSRARFGPARAAVAGCDRRAETTPALSGRDEGGGGGAGYAARVRAGRLLLLQGRGRVSRPGAAPRARLVPDRGVHGPRLRLGDRRRGDAGLGAEVSARLRVEPAREPPVLQLGRRQHLEGIRGRQALREAGERKPRAA